MDTSRDEGQHNSTTKPLVSQMDEEWHTVPVPAKYHVLRETGVEAPFSGEFPGEGCEGVYRCRRCGVELFCSETKFDSGCSWPSFYDPSSMDSVVIDIDYKLGCPRIEIRCASRDSHLSHVFPDAPQTPTGQYYCMSPVSLSFEPAE